jgi:hypothetical protein
VPRDIFIPVMEISGVMPKAAAPLALALACVLLSPPKGHYRIRPRHRVVLRHPTDLKGWEKRAQLCTFAAS